MIMIYHGIATCTLNVFTTTSRTFAYEKLVLGWKVALQVLTKLFYCNLPFLNFSNDFKFSAIA